MTTLLVTGSSGLIGSEVVAYFCSLGWPVHGIDNNMRADFFGPEGDTRGQTRRLLATYATFQHHHLDIRDRAGVEALMRTLWPPPSSCTPPPNPVTIWPPGSPSTISRSMPSVP